MRGGDYYGCNSFSFASDWETSCLCIVLQQCVTLLSHCNNMSHCNSMSHCCVSFQQYVTLQQYATLLSHCIISYWIVHHTVTVCHTATLRPYAKQVVCASYRNSMSHCKASYCDSMTTPCAQLRFFEDDRARSSKQIHVELVNICTSKLIGAKRTHTWLTMSTLVTNLLMHDTYIYIYIYI